MKNPFERDKTNDEVKPGRSDRDPRQSKRGAGSPTSSQFPGWVTDEIQSFLTARDNR